MPATSFSTKLARHAIIQQPTPVQEFPEIGQQLGLRHFFVKREDLTDSVYGGNKVRNLEFILGDALQKGAERIVTVAPLGSNFVAALAAQTKKIGIPTDIFHFVPAMSRLIRSQAKFSARNGARLKLTRGSYYGSPVKATISAEFDLLNSAKSYLVSPGGSNPIGVLGHICAVMELAEQISKNELPEPDVIVVGAGTCGTMAGLVAGVKIAGLKTRIVGVRCVDRLICNRFRIAKLANAAAKLMGRQTQIEYRDIDLRDVQSLKYGFPLEDAENMIAEMKQSTGIELDTTYTTKVFSYLKTRALDGKCADQTVLYWHTFSPLALS
jgi:1-aminocyclopropane-1-carboxylate deaminase/D-cysteine desulfhydrase-like pyridoxal-dependent ACC family enzyme